MLGAGSKDEVRGLSRERHLGQSWRGRWRSQSTGAHIQASTSGLPSNLQLQSDDFPIDHSFPLTIVTMAGVSIFVLHRSETQGLR